jgi:hypothetical protein
LRDTLVLEDELGAELLRVQDLHREQDRIEVERGGTGSRLSRGRWSHRVRDHF